MLNFRKIAATSKGTLLLRYFTENTPEPIHPQPIDAKGRQLDSGGRLTTYYSGREGRASWRPDMPAAIARAAGIDPRHMPRDADLARLFEGKRADTGEAWSRHARTLSGFDLVFSPHKSVTLAAEFAATPAESAAILHAIDRANDAAMRYVAQVLGWARKGAGGEEGVEPGAVGWVSFRHSTARPTLQVQDGPGGQTYLMDAPIAGDPHAHIHNFLMNLVVTATGRVGSLNTQMLTDVRVKEFGAYFQAVVADELRRLGIRTGYDAGHQAVVVSAIPEQATKTFSKRDREVLGHARAFAENQGLEWDTLSVERKMGIIEQASAEGRLGKVKADERRVWREQAAAMGWSHTTVMEGPVPEPLPDADRFDIAYEFAARHLADEFNTAAVISHEKLGMYAARGLIGTGIAGGIDDIGRVVELLEQRGIMLKGERVALIVGLFEDTVRVTNTAQVRIEEHLAAKARDASRDKSGALSDTAMRQAIASAGTDFTAEQRAGGGYTRPASQQQGWHPDRVRRPVLLLAPGDNRKQRIGKRTLQVQRLADRRRKPGVALLGRGQDDGHGLGMDRRHDGVGLAGQEGEQLVRAFDRLRLGAARTGPGPPQTREGEQRPVLAQREPVRHGRLAGRILAEARCRDQAPVLRLHPGAPVARRGVADVRDGPVARDRGWAGEAPAHHRQLASAPARADHGRHLVRKDGGQRRHVADTVHHGPIELADRLLAFGDAVEIAHAARLTALDPSAPGGRVRCRAASRPGVGSIRILGVPVRFGSGGGVRRAVRSAARR
jgi:hypothetical protein